MKRKVLNKILKNPMSITGDAELDARLNELLYHDDIEYVKQGLNIADSISVDVLEKAVGEMIKSNVYHVTSTFSIRKKDNLISFALLEMQELYDQPFSFWKHVKVLDLSGIDLDYIPDGIGYLKNLELLNLDGINIKTLPNWISNLQNLRYLYLDDSDIQTLPESIGDLQNLEWLSLNRASVVKLPKSIGKLKNLQALALYDDSLKSLPPSMVNLQNLRGLYFSGGQLKTLPDWIGNLQNLEELGMMEVSYIPNWIGKLKNLETLYISSDHIAESEIKCLEKFIPYVEYY